MMDGIIHFTKKTGCHVQATRNSMDGHQGSPPALLTIMRPRKQRSIDINDGHCSLGHVNEATAQVTAK